jgi:hypothetical protein
MNTDTADTDTDTPAALLRSLAGHARHDARASVRNGDRLVANGFTFAAETAYRHAAADYRYAARLLSDAAVVRGGSINDTREAQTCVCKAHGADLLAEGCR